MAGIERKPPPPGWERHPHDFNLVRRVPERTVGSAMFGHLKTNEEWRKQQDEADAKERLRRERWR
jgi:hypothetical protein